MNNVLDLTNDPNLEHPTMLQPGYNQFGIITITSEDIGFSPETNLD